MPDVLVVQSASHPVGVDRFESALGADYDVSQLELPPGTLHVRADEELVDALADKQAVFLRAGEVTAPVIRAADDLRVVAVHGSGYDHVDLDAATRNGVVVTHNPEGPGPAVVEHTVALMVTLLRDLPTRFERTARGEWSRDPVSELGQRTVGVVGLGWIGFRVARIASQVFGAEVIAHDPYVSGELESPIWPRFSRTEVTDLGVELVAKDDLFERAELVTLHTPLTDRTADMVGASELAALAGGYLINTSRGGVVNEEALNAAVEDGTLRGVGLDVLRTEPPDADHPLLAHPRVYVTPHIASATDGYPPRAADAAAEKIRSVLSGGRPETVVNPAVFDRLDGPKDPR